MGGKLFFGEETGMDRKKARILHCSGEAAIAVTGGKYKGVDTMTFLKAIRANLESALA